MSESSNRIVLTRREALLLSASAGVGIAAGKSAFASDSVKTAAHQEPGNLSTPAPPDWEDYRNDPRYLKELDRRARIEWGCGFDLERFREGLPHCQ